MDTKIFSGVQVYYDHITMVNTVQNILIVLESVGETKCGINFVTDNYQMMARTFATKEDFHHTDNTRKTAQEFGIVQRSRIPEKPGFFCVFPVTFVKRGRSVLRLVFIKDDSYTVFLRYFEHFSLTEEKACYPTIQSPSWY